MKVMSAREIIAATFAAVESETSAAMVSLLRLSKVVDHEDVLDAFQLRLGRKKKRQFLLT